MKKKEKNISCWVCVDALKVGTWKQAEALAEKWIKNYQKKPVSLPSWCRLMPPFVFALLPQFLKQKAIKTISDPLPDIIIAAGRQAVLVALTLRHQVKTIVLMDPGVSAKYFNVVIAPIHDELQGDNVISTQGAIHGIDPENLTFPKDLQGYASPRIAVLLGGNSIHGTYEENLAINMANDLRNLLTSNPALKGGSLIITPSRRTPLKWLEIFEKQIEGMNYWIWDQKNDNPYPHFLKGIDAIVVCEDSISMASEACVMEKQVLIYPTGIKKEKFKRFYQQLFSNGYAQKFDVDAEFTTPPRLKELNRVVRELNRLDIL